MPSRSPMAFAFRGPSDFCNNHNICFCRFEIKAFIPLSLPCCPFIFIERYTKKGASAVSKHPLLENFFCKYVCLLPIPQRLHLACDLSFINGKAKQRPMIKNNAAISKTAVTDSHTFTRPARLIVITIAPVKSG